MIFLLSDTVKCLLSVWILFAHGIRNPDDPEPVTQGSTPKDWKAEVYEARYQGLMYAGMTEFNWILDVRINDEDSETWSVGNLISFYHVMTTCKAVTKGKRKGTALHLSLRNVRSIVLHFTTSYLWASIPDAEQFNPIASRYVKSISPYTKCDSLLLAHDFALITLASGIHPFVPLAGYMPFPESYFKNPDWAPIKNHTLVCYIASFGKDHVNINSSVTVGNRNNLKDHKIKYRVYFVEWEDCKKYLNKIRPCPYDQRCRAKPDDPKFQKNVMCFMPRKKVGALCDHDRGAPLVCGGFAYGIVVKGIGFRFCNNLVQFPVYVVSHYSYTAKLKLAYKAQHESKSYGHRNPKISALPLTILVIYILIFKVDFNTIT